MLIHQNNPSIFSRNRFCISLCIGNLVSCFRSVQYCSSTVFIAIARKCLDIIFICYCSKIVRCCLKLGIAHAITPIFKFSPDVRKVIYTTNAIESLNSTYRKLNRQRSVFPSDTALLKALYLAAFEATKKWTMSIRNWGQVYGELSIMYEERLPE